MEHVLEVKNRETTGTKASARVRADGEIPGVLYGKDNENTHFLISERTLQEVLRHHEKLVKVKVEKGKPIDALIHAIQYEPVSGDILHCDLHIIKLDEEIEVSVPLELFGAELAPGASSGGTVEMILHDVTVSCLPNKIPEQITIDASSMEIGDSKTVADIDAGEGVKILTDSEEIVVVVHEPVDIEAETDVEESLKALDEEPTVQKQKDDSAEGESGSEG